jgi:hypothetical protein
MQKVSQYMTAAKTIDAQIEDALKGLPKDQGYDFDKIRTEAKKAAFGSVDEKGNYNLNPVERIDPTKNYVAQIVREHPEAVTDMSGWDKFTKNLPKSTSDTDVTTVTGPGESNRYRVNAQKNYLEDFDKDEKGQVTGISPKSEIAFDTTPDGKKVPIKDPETGEPMKLLSTPYFNDLLNHNPHLADALRRLCRKSGLQALVPELLDSRQARLRGWPAHAGGVRRGSAPADRRRLSHRWRRDQEPRDRAGDAPGGRHGAGFPGEFLLLHAQLGVRLP